MNHSTQQLFHGYLDETLSPDEFAELEQWLKAAPENRREFARLVVLHDRLRNEQMASNAIAIASATTLCWDAAAPDNDTSPVATTRSQSRQPIRQRFLSVRRQVMVASSIVAASLLLAFWTTTLNRAASAAVIELNRIIMANAKMLDRTYRITVEEAVTPVRRQNEPKRPEDARPPKPPMDDAVLYVRGGGQFVLSRKTADGLPFVTGCNGQSSWAVRPDGPVRCSSDLDRFNHDVPGHEHAMPLINIEEGLERLRAAYDLQLLPVEMSDDQAELRLLVAVRKPKERGPRRVEITYAVSSGLIQQMRFVDMPYGPDRLTLRMTLVDEQALGAKFFDHQSHHNPEREVRFE